MTQAAIDRRALRAGLIRARLDLSDAERRDRSDRITAHLLDLLRSFPAPSLAFYWPHRGEYDARAVAEWIVAEGGAVLLPVVVGAHQALVFREWRPGTEMIPGLYGIPHPAGVGSAHPDIILAPIVGFDNAGYRLGYGGGFYDRTIVAFNHRPVTIGVGFECGRLDSIEPRPHDGRMDVIVTEQGVFPSEGSSFPPQQT